MKAIFTLFLISCIGLHIQATNARFEYINSNSTDPLAIAQAYIHSNLKEWGLTESDIADMTISDRYTDKSTGITRIYFEQRYKGIPVNHAILNVCMTSDNKVYYSTCRFVPHLDKKINAVQPVLNVTAAVNKAALHFGFAATSIKQKTSVRTSQFLFEDPSIAREDITVDLIYLNQQGKLYLAWDVFFAPKGSHDGWNIRVDALNGEVLNKVNRTLYCKTSDSEDDFPCFEDLCDDHAKEVTYKILPTTPVSFTMDNPTGPQYNVWPAPLESPWDGPRKIVTDPADPLASPYGWHDTNGQPGAEYSITAGNNTYSYQDTINAGFAHGDEPDGGPELNFDFPFDSTTDPRFYNDAATVNLFYWINYLHDFTYHFGFDEAAGNFQKNNYGRGGLDNDFIYSVSQVGSAGDSLANNAEYVNKNDGITPSILMWDFIKPEKYFIVNEPASVSGKYYYCYPSAGWGAGAYVSDQPVTGDVVIVNDGVESPSTADACQSILNADELAGKIALIDRGACQFGFKALQAQNAGAIAVIICSQDNKFYTMAAGPDAPNVQIPVISIPLKYCNALRQLAGHGLNVTISNHADEGPRRYDSDLQSSMIGHEFGHGLSIRLAGGPDKQCLDNAEQMGEGWCDFLGLVTTVKPGDVGSMPRPFAAYVERETSLGKGLRRYAYCTDMSVSPLTYGNVAIEQERHAIGEVWANMLWDMYWAMVEKYGWSEDPYNEQSGNYKAIRLVVDGLKNMACDPGFVDGRNAILAADSVLYQGDDICLLWNVFARRGLGYSADQGSSEDAGDQVEAFDTPPFCSHTLYVEKSVTDFIQPGDDIKVTIHVSNFKNETATNVVVTDQIPYGTTYKYNSSNYTAVQQGHELFFDLGNLLVNEVDTITYILHTQDDIWSQRLFLDDVPDTNTLHWTPTTLGAAAVNTWGITDTLSANTGTYTWAIKEIADKSQQALIMDPNVYTFHVTGQQPALRFYHRYDTQAGLNGGMVEVRVVGEANWEQVSDKMIRNGYKRQVDYRTFLSTGLNAFSGNSGDALQATYVDLSKWADQDIQVRFRFGTFTNTHEGMGWCIDDIEFMDLKNYNEYVCVNTDQGDFECAIAPEMGTIVDSRWDPVSGTETLQQLDAAIYPNPATDLFTIALSLEKQQDVNVRVFTLDGLLVAGNRFACAGQSLLNINTINLPSGIYMVRLSSGEGQYVQKLVIQH